MKRLLFVLGVIGVALIAFLYLLSGTGFFRTIKAKHGDPAIELTIMGPEDVEVSYDDSFAIISSTGRKKYPPEEEESANLYLLELEKMESPEAVLLTADLSFPFAPHGLSLLKMDSTYLVKVINHTDEGHSIEVFELFKKDSLVHRTTLRDPSMIAPNDIVQVGSITGENIDQESVGIDQGSLISGSTVASEYDGYLIIGSALDNKLVFVKNEMK